jgi:uncharacterized protein YjbJ (UPF0337 family)
VVSDWVIDVSSRVCTSRGIFIPHGFASVRTGKEGREGGSDVYRLRNPGVHRRGSLDHLSRAARIKHADKSDNKERVVMGEVRNKARNAAQHAKGKAKESTGRATGNRSLKTKGKTDRAKAKTKKAAERVKDRLR